MEKYQVFNLLFDDPELEEEFHTFFKRNGLNPLFTNEHRVKPISVTWTDARSVVNDRGKFKTVKGVRTETGGAYHMQLKEFANFVAMSTNNQNYENMLTKVIHDAKTFQKMMNNIKELMAAFAAMPQEYIYNMWNAVKYTNILN